MLGQFQAYAFERTDSLWKPALCKKLNYSETSMMLEARLAA